MTLGAQVLFGVPESACAGAGRGGGAGAIAFLCSVPLSPKIVSSVVVGMAVLGWQRMKAGGPLPGYLCRL